MKRSLFIFCCIMTICGLESCNKESYDRIISIPSFKVSNETFAVYADGGSYTLTYEVEDAVSNGMISCAGDVSWISNIDTSIPGMISFTVGKNTDEDLRTGNIILTYRYTDDAEQYVRKKVGVVQYGICYPKIIVQSDVVCVTYEGGLYSFNYTVENDVDGGEITCSADVNWIDDFDCSTFGYISFNVHPRYGNDLRTAKITLSYSFGADEVTTNVSVIQDHPVGGSDFYDIIGSYTASGILYADGKETNATWTLSFIGDSNDGSMLWIDGLLPTTVGDSEYGNVYLPYCTVSDDHYQIIVKLPYIISAMIDIDDETYYRGFIACPMKGYYNYENLTFTYNDLDGTWESDYGVHDAIFMYQNAASISGSISCVMPGFILKKIENQ